MKRIFAGAVGRIGIEIQSCCNRRCSNGPDVVGDRLGEDVRMAGSVRRLVLDGLAGIGFSRNFVSRGDSEPPAPSPAFRRAARAWGWPSRATSRAHGGDIELDQSPLGGLRARIRLPV